MSDKLKPCPFCGKEGLPGTDRTLHYVFCSKCEAQGPLEYSEEKAIAAWNKRVREEKL